ncbi:MAG: hypothetical protein QOF57_548 [Frankiaceae bacterium]|nr:hypothetical protein [Frankiaceae bacterium]
MISPAPCVALGTCTYQQAIRRCDEPGYAGTPCTGPPVGCPPGETLYDIFVMSAGQPLPYVPYPAVCRATPPVDPQVFLDSVLISISPDPVEATVSPFTNALPVTMPVYLQVTSVPADQTITKTDGTLTVTVTLTNPRFVWYFDDNVTLPPTTDRGGPYPTGTVTHAFQHKGTHRVYLQVIWDANWHMVDPAFTIDRAGTAQIEQANRPQFDVTIVEAHAVLVG